LEGVPEAEQLRRLSDDELMDHLLDRRGAIDAKLWLECFSALAAARFEILTLEVCQREYLLLNPLEVADLTLSRLVVLYRLGRRVRPCSRWLPELVNQAVGWARLRPRFCAFSMEDARTEDEKTRAALAQLINQMDGRTRQIVHLSWLERMKPDQVAEATGLDRETVERILAGALGAVVMTATGQDVFSLDGTERPEPDATTEGSEKEAENERE
jgi:RNA polymerase sigma factor (sigma-70 family)